MLILTRRVKESILIGNDITVTVLDIRSNQVRLGVTAPKNISVFREELHARIQGERLRKETTKPEASTSLST